MIDTLKYSKDLEKAGLTPEQAELFVRGQLKMITDNVATKADIKEIYHLIDKVEQKLQSQSNLFGEFQTSVSQRFQAQEKSMNQHFQSQGAKFELKLQQVTNRLAFIMISFMTVLSGLIGIVVKIS